MPFGYFGAKKGLARYYPPPAFGHIIEPFAGSAGYSLHYWRPGIRVTLIEKDPHVVALWRRLQAPSAADDLRSIPPPIAGARTTEPLIIMQFHGRTGSRTLQGTVERNQDYGITPRMAAAWPSALRRLLAALPVIRDWTIIEGDYTDAPDVRATWFIDPPYWVPDDAEGTRGDGYRFGATTIDFDALGEWCQARLGQVIVCEQMGATWLPFRPFKPMRAMANGGYEQARLEVVWTRTPGTMTSTPGSAARSKDAADRRQARIARR